MKITPITSYNQKPSFKKINQKYLHWAIEDIKICQNVSTDWQQMMSFEVFLFKTMSRQDGIDTVLAVKEILCGQKNLGLDELLKSYRNPND